MTKSLTNCVMDRYVVKVTDPVLKQALLNHSLVVTRARAEVLMNQRPVPEIALVPLSDQTSEQSQSDLISSLLNTLQATSALDLAIDNAVKAV